MTDRRHVTLLATIAASLSLGVTTGVFASESISRVLKPEDKIEAPKRSYHALSNPVIIRVENSDAMVQMRVAFSSMDDRTSIAVKRQDAAISSAVMIDMTEAGPAIIGGDLDKKAIRSRIRHVTEDVIRGGGTSPIIEDVYLTDFLILNFYS